MKGVDWTMWTHVAILFLACCLPSTSGHSDELITCYKCRGPAVNSTCGDPMEDPDGLEQVECEAGACVKWAYYFGGELIIERSCSQKMREKGVLQVKVYHVCRREKMGNGYLCMCPKSLCNSARNISQNQILPFLTLLAALTSYNAPWRT